MLSCHACGVSYAFLSNVTCNTNIKKIHWLFPQVLLLDELTTFLDSTDQDSVLKAVRGIIDAQGPDPVTALWVR